MYPNVTDGESQIESQLGFQESGFDTTARGRAGETTLTPLAHRAVILLADAADRLAPVALPMAAPPSLAQVWRYATDGAYCPDWARRFRRAGRAWGRGAVAWCGLWYGLAAAVQVPLWKQRVGSMWAARSTPEGVGLWTKNPVPLGELARSTDRSVPALAWTAPVVALTGLCYVAAWTGERSVNAVFSAAVSAAVLVSIAAIAAHH